MAIKQGKRITNKRDRRHIVPLDWTCEDSSFIKLDFLDPLNQEPSNEARTRREEGVGEDGFRSLIDELD